MPQTYRKKLAFGLHIAIALATVALYLSLGAIVYHAAEGGSVAWWTYPLFAAFVAACFAADDWLVGAETSCATPIGSKT